MKFLELHAGKNDADALVSVGIDVGTTTTHLVICLLFTENTTGGFRVPQLKIGRSKIVYESPIYFTPLLADGEIDAEAVYSMLFAEYKKNDLSAEQVSCGAAIVTGESARRRNASTVVKQLAKLAGDFVAASAGPEYESVLAARGSGAFERSIETGRSVCNIDIGGGTTNIAVYRKGVLQGAWCLCLGGRFIRFDHSNRVASITESGRALLQAMAMTYDIGEIVEEEDLETLVQGACRVILESVLEPDSRSELASDFLVGQAPLAELLLSIEEYWFSGGVAALMEKPPADNYRYNDMGARLAKALVFELNRRAQSYTIKSNAIRATVIGAGTKTIQLSGHTVFYEPSVLPQKNIPILRLTGEQIGFETGFLEHGYDHGIEQFKDSAMAFLLPELQLFSYDNLTCLADKLVCFIRDKNLKEPVLFVLVDDAAMALGQQLKMRMPEYKFIVLDGIECNSGDFLEVGQPIANGLTLPVVVKSFVFSG